METIEVERRISNLLNEAAIEVEGEDCNFTVTVISDEFSGLNTMKRQQKILSVFAEQLQSGALHALSIKAYTFDEWNNKTSGLVQLSL